MEEKLAEIEDEHGIARTAVQTVSAVNDRISDRIETDPELADIYVLGEVSNHSASSGGHCFFDLKDEDSQLSCVVFDRVREALSYEPQDGDEVLVKATVEYYGRRGEPSVKVSEVFPVGEGIYYKELRERMEKLEEEGLFDAEHKQELPDLPEKIGVVTSKNGAAVKDIVNAIRARNETVDIYVKHAAVQGENAVDDITDGIAFFDNRFDVDVIVVGRGGGSIEDLQAFNTEAVARAIFDCNTPVVSGVGHRTDETIAGYMADYGAITPTAAGKHAVVDTTVLANELEQLADRLQDTYDDFVTKEERSRELDIIKSREQIYWAVIAVQFLVILALLGQVVL